MKYELPIMKRGGGGAICNTASVAALTGPGGMCAYAASKCGVHGLTRENASGLRKRRPLFGVNTRLFEAIAYGMISNDAILSPSSPKKYRRSTGLPGKFPTRWLVTTVFQSFSSHTKGSLVYSYFVEASVFHCLIAARPL